MPIMNLWYYMNGYITISIRGSRSERLINLAINRGIILRDIRRFGSIAYMKVDIDGFKKLRPLARRTRCKVKIEKKAGIPFFIYKLTVRRGFVAGAVFFVILLYLLSSFIWFVDIVGTEEVDPHLVSELSRELGLKPGAFKNTLDLEKISNEVVIRVPDISWAGIEITGTRARLEIVEKVKGEEPGEVGYSHIIASKDGLITDIMVISGMAEVSVGDTVTAGEVLISGILRADFPEVEEEEDDPEANRIRESYVRSRGTVEARVWYEGSGVSTLLEKKYEPTGKYSSSSYIKVGDKQFYTRGDGQNPFTYSRLNQSRRIIRWRNFKLPVEIVHLQYNELNLVEKELTHQEALDKAVLQAQEEARKQLPSQAEVVEENVEILDTEDEQVIEVRYVIETIEQIGKEKPMVLDS